MLQWLEAYAGPAAGIATSALWTATALFFTAASKRIGPVAVNAARIALAIVLLGVTHRLLAGAWAPAANGDQVLLLGLSGIVGLSLGDQFLFTAFVRIGPRIAMLIMATAPLLAALFGWLALDETMGRTAWLGIALTLFGVSWVIFERRRNDSAAHRAHRVRGIVFAFIAAGCQAGGLLLSKQGMGHGWLPPDQHLDPQAATLIRMVFAGLGVVPILALHLFRRERRYIRRERFGSPKSAWLLAAGGAVVGPYLGVWMSLVAADRTPL
jgi:drug/metabolite transporter (DMT)-like permease